MRAYPENTYFTSPRVRGVSFLCTGVLIFLAAYLWRMQVLGGEEYARMAKNNRVRFVRVRAARGLIYDREGGILVDNRPSFDIEVVPEDVEDRELMENSLASILGVDAATVRGRLKNGRPFAYMPVKVASDVSNEAMTAVEERQPSLPGVHVGVRGRRRYLHGSLAAHLIGYIGMIDASELEEMRGEEYTQQDLVGKAGVEKSYERLLAGRVGGEGIQVDSRGYLDKVLYRHEAEPGLSIHLNLDLDTQKAAEEILRDAPGAIVALDPRNGEIIAIASSPAYDPNIFVPPVDVQAAREIISGAGRPLFNRAIQGLYPPGSVFKPINALAGLESGALNEETRVVCGGIFTLGKRQYKCWYERGHGSVDVVDGLMMSCNVFFYTAGMRAGPHDMAEMACEFGIDEKSGIDLPGEAAGVVPTDEWCREKGIGRWNPGDTVAMAIGQGYLLITPLRAALVMAAIANGGTIYRPRVVNRVVSPLGELVRRYPPEIMRRIPLDERNLRLVRDGLRKAVGSNFGTGQKARLADVEIAGKTGTVQAGTEAERVNHAWFVGYAPYDDPRIVVAVLLEGKESGGHFAAPAARKIFAAFFGLDTGD